MKTSFVSTFLVLLSVSCLIDSTHGSDNDLEPKSRHKRQLLILCEKAGFIPYPMDSTKYIQCVFISPRWYYYVYNCPPAATFDQSRQLCVIQPATVPPPTTTAAATTTEESSGGSEAPSTPGY